MACQELVELVTAYLDGVLSAADRARFEAHVAECDDCARYVEQFESTVRVLGLLREDDVAPEALDDLLIAFRAWAGDGPGGGP